MKILFLSATPRDRDYLRVRKEFIEIQGIIERGLHRDLLELICEWEIQPGELPNLLVVHKPHIVHFSGHGESNGIIVIDAEGNAIHVDERVLTSLFEELRDNIRIVVLNACDTRSQAQAIAQIVGCAIGISQGISDTPAIMFATSFYKMLAYGYSVQKAFNVSKINLQLEGYAEEARFLKLYVGNNVDPNQIYLVEQPYKGCWLLSHPELWNKYVIILDFAKQVHHTFQTLDTQHLNEFISKLDKILPEPDRLQEIHSFQTSWINYVSAVNEFLDEFVRKFSIDNEMITKAFNKLLTLEDQTNQRILAEAHQKYYKNIKNGITEYSKIHSEVLNLIGRNLFTTLKDPNTANQIPGRIFGLLTLARSLTVDSDNLLRRLIELLL